MKVIVHGVTGKMGQVVANLAKEGFSEAQYVAGVSPDVAVEMPGLYKSLGKCTEEADVMVDFSFHGATEALLDYCISRKMPVVIATTGHTEEEKAKITEAAKSIPVFYSANMSVGVAVLCDLAKKAASAFPGANIEIVETHHNQKLDVPSGTALMIANAIKSVRPQSTYNIGRPDNGKRTDEEIGIHSLRLGNITGIHEVVINTGNEAITLKHEAYSRSLFGEGALRAAEFLYKQEKGLYTMADMVR